MEKLNMDSVGPNVKNDRDGSGEFVATERVYEHGRDDHYMVVVLRPDQIAKIAAAVVEALAKPPRP